MISSYIIGLNKTGTRETKRKIIIPSRAIQSNAPLQTNPDEFTDTPCTPSQTPNYNEIRRRPHLKFWQFFKSITCQRPNDKEML